MLNKYGVMMTVFKMTEKLKEYDSPETLKKLHDIELMILSDFIDICEKNNLTYFAAWGTALGAIRHKGFIPWDDDVDIIMFRKDYNKFLKIIKNNEKYDFFAMENTNDYYKVFGKLSLKGTKFHDFWYENASFIMGINIDILIIDFVPNNSLLKRIYIKKRDFNRKLSWILEVLNSDMYVSKNKERVGRFLKKIFAFIGINQKLLLKQYTNLFNEDNSSSEVCEVNDRVIFPRYLFDNVITVPFEHIEINVPKDFDVYLKIMYGDYMKIPPVEERFNHYSGELDFGKYGDLF